MELERSILRWQIFLGQFPEIEAVYGILLVVLGLVGLKKAKFIFNLLDKWRKAWQYPIIGEKVGIPLIKGFAFLVTFLGLMYILLVVDVSK